VVYGPVLDRGQDQQQGGFGRLLGAVVVIGALLVMGGATFAILGQAPPAAPPGTSPTPAVGAVLSPSPVLPAPSPQATPVLPSPPPAIATPQITLPPTPEPTPEPTPIEVEVREGAGFVTFGSGWDRAHNMQDISSTFTPGGRIAWSAIFTEPAGVPALDVVAARVNAEDGAEQVTWEERYEMQNQSSERVLRRVPINRLTDGPGIYVVRYLRGEEVLSEGLFELVDD
jgi:hypothetical protein